MSGRKNTLITYIAKNQSLSASFNSAPTIVRFLDNISYQINVTTTNSQGTFDVEVSNDYYVNEANGDVVVNSGTWVPLTLAGGTPTVAAADTNITISLTQLPYYAVRLSYTSSVAGTGTCSIYVSAKALD